MVSCRLGRVKYSVGPHRMDEARPEEMISSQILRGRPGVCFHRCVILLVGLAGPTLMKKKNFKMRIGSLPLSWNGRITQNSFWAWSRQLKKHETGRHRMAEARPEEMISS